MCRGEGHVSKDCSNNRGSSLVVRPPQPQQKHGRKEWVVDSWVKPTQLKDFKMNLDFYGAREQQA